MKINLLLGLYFYTSDDLSYMSIVNIRVYKVLEKSTVLCQDVQWSSIFANSVYVLNILGCVCVRFIRKIPTVEHCASYKIKDNLRHKSVGIFLSYSYKGYSSSKL